MAAPRPLNNTCDIYRPFGAADPIHAGVPCRLVPSLFKGRSPTGLTSTLEWTHYLDTAWDVDVRDGCSRAAVSNELVYGEGDEVRVFIGERTIRFVVVWVENRYSGEDDHGYRRVYMMRDTVNWPVP